MKTYWLFALGAVAGATAATFLPHIVSPLLAAMPTASAKADQSPKSLASPKRTEEKLAFTVHASKEVVAPIFGARRERDWAPEWDLKFIYPLPANDMREMVFAVAHHHYEAV